ncbi:MAG: DUF4870 domain-containing protein [Phaeodactylibacter sp.]|nr:DUF4870 domain-containing protein [Phaeodactylibacter sp.]
MQEPLDSHETREGLIPDKDELMWSTFAHLGFLAGLVIPFGNIVAPLVIWLVYKDRSSYIDFHGKEALNFQITMTIALIGSAFLILLFIGIFLVIGAVILSLVLSIIAATKANNGEYYRYPFSIRFIQ